MRTRTVICYSYVFEVNLSAKKNILKSCLVLDQSFIPIFHRTEHQSHLEGDFAVWLLKIYNNGKKIEKAFDKYYFKEA